MSRKCIRSSLFVLALSLAAPCAIGQQLQTFRDCAVGKRVSTNDGRRGTITRLDTAWSYCYVRFDDGKEASFLYSLLNAEGGSAKPGGPALSPGVYECIASGRASVMDMRISGSNSYSVPDGAGKFHIEPGGKIVFESGPLKTFHSKLLSGGRIGLNTDGGSFYSTACEPNRNKR